MTKVKKLIALMLVVCIAATVGIVSVSAATVDDAESVQAKYDGIKVHVYSEDAHRTSIIGTAFRRISQQITPVLK